MGYDTLKKILKVERYLIDANSVTKIKDFGCNLYLMKSICEITNCVS